MNLSGKYNKQKIFSSQINNKYKNKYQKVDTKQIIFINQYSVKDDNLKFTNFLERNFSTRNLYLKNIIDNCLINPQFFDNNFIGRDVSVQTHRDLQKIKRVKKILELYDNFPQNYETIYKATLKSNGERGFQIYFTMNNNIKYVYIIDLYHLIIASKLNRKKNQFSLSEEYERRKNYNKNIKDILFDLEVKV